MERKFKFEAARRAADVEPECVLALCHLERARRSIATEGESKDPDKVSPAMRIQGVLPRTSPRHREDDEEDPNKPQRGGLR